ncbi:MAG: cation:proton antiporter [archaeon]
MVMDFALVFDIGLIIIFAGLFNIIARLLKQPPLLSYIIAGIVLGSIFVGSLKLQLFGMPLSVTNKEEIMLLSELGVAFLLFSVGIETNFSKIISFAKTILIGTLLQVALTALFFYILAVQFALLPFYEALLVGLILSFSSTMLVVKILSDSHSLDTLHGRLMLGFLIVQDCIVILLMPVFSSSSGIFNQAMLTNFAFSGLTLLVLTYVLLKYIFPPLFKYAVRDKNSLFLLALSICFGFIFLSKYVFDIPMVIGAFVAGLSLSTLPYTYEIYAEIRGVRDLFVTIFFVMLGMQINFVSILQEQYLLLILLCLIVIFLVKPLILTGLTLFAGYGTRIALLVGFGLAQLSEFSFVLAGEGLKSGLLSQGTFSVVLIVVAISMVVTPYIFNYKKAIVGLFDSFFTKFNMFNNQNFERKIGELQDFEKVSDHLVIIGAGTMGNILLNGLKDIPLVVLDHNSDLIRMLKAKGVNAVYGEAQNDELWKKLNLKAARALIVVIPEADVSAEIIKYAKTENHRLPIFGRAHYYTEGLQLYDAGCDFVIMPHVVGSNVLLKNLLCFIKTKKLTECNALQDEFINYLKEASKDEQMKSIFKFRNNLFD